MPPTSVSILLFSVLLCCTSHNVLALLPDRPLQTLASDEVFNVQSWSPRPTGNPSHHPSNIFARQNLPDFPGDAQKVLVAPDNTCGYISGLQGAPFSCSSSYKCVFFSATGNGYGPIACCTTGMSCRIRTACVARADYYGSRSAEVCDAGCKLDRFTLKCTDAGEPYCGRLRFTSPNVQDFWCVKSSVATDYTGVTTYSNQPQRVFTTMDKSDLWPVSTPATSSSNSSPTSDDGLIPPSSIPSKRRTHVGAIVGGAIGGIAVIAIICFGAYFFCYRRKSKPRPSELGGVRTLHDLDMPYGGRVEVEANPSKIAPSSGYGYNQHYDPPKPQELDASTPLKPHDVHLPEREGGVATSRYAQVPTEEVGGGYYQAGAPRA